MSAAQLFTEAPLVVCLTPGSLPSAAPYRIARPESPAGLHLNTSKPEELSRWIEEAKRRNLVLRFDRDAFLCWDWSFSDIARIEANWPALVTFFGIPLPPERPGRVCSEEESAPCWSGWHATKHLQARKSTAEKEERSEIPALFIAEEPPIPEDTPLCFVDVETTGGAPRDGARVVQIALRRFEPTTGEVIDFSSLVNSEGIESEYWAWKVHQIPKWKISKAPLFGRMVGRVVELLSGAVFIAHNGRSCDEPFVKNELSRVGAEWPCVASVDTLRVARSVYSYMNSKKKKDGGEKFSFALGSLATFLCVSSGLKHDAKGDVETLYNVWFALRERHPKVTLTEMVRM